MGKFIKVALQHNRIFWVCLIVSIALLITSFFLPPMGVISPSVLQGVAELFAFATLGSVVAAIDKGIDAKLEHNGTSLTIGDLNNKGDE